MQREWESCSDRRTGLGRGSRWELRIQGLQPIWGPTPEPKDVSHILLPGQTPNHQDPADSTQTRQCLVRVLRPWPGGLSSPKVSPYSTASPAPWNEYSLGGRVIVLVLMSGQSRPAPHGQPRASG